MKITYRKLIIFVVLLQRNVSRRGLELLLFRLKSAVLRDLTVVQIIQLSQSS